MKLTEQQRMDLINAGWTPPKEKPAGPVGDPEREKQTAPWKDYAGNTLQEGDYIKHPDGTIGKVFVSSSPEHVGYGCWRVIYEDGENLLLANQVNDRGQAVKTTLAGNLL